MSMAQDSWEVELAAAPLVGTSVDRLCVRFRGRVDAGAGAASVARLIELMGEEPVDLVFEVSEVRGYESGARKAWQSALWPRRSQVRSMTVVTTSKLTEMGARVFSSFLGIPCEVHSPTQPS